MDKDSSELFQLILDDMGKISADIAQLRLSMTAHDIIIQNILESLSDENFELFARIEGEMKTSAAFLRNIREERPGRAGEANDIGGEILRICNIADT